VIKIRKVRGIFADAYQKCLAGQFHDLLFHEISIMKLVKNLFERTANAESYKF
jgi:hypothetical protein